MDIYFLIHYVPNLLLPYLYPPIFCFKFEKNKRIKEEKNYDYAG